MSGTAKKGVRAYDILEKILYRKGNKKAHVYSADHENTCFLLVFSNREDRFLSNEVSLHSGEMQPTVIESQHPREKQAIDICTMICRIVCSIRGQKFGN